MANLTIFGLTQLTSAGADIVNDLVPVWDNDVAETKKMTLSDLRNLMSPANWSDSFSSATQATSSWTPNNAAANVNAAIIPKGTGAIVADIPDGTATGGNARGIYAVDLQMIRSAATQVASAAYTTILGGRNNMNRSSDSTLVGGNGNIIYDHRFNGHGVIVGGQSNRIGTADGNTDGYNFIGGGWNNTAACLDSCVIVGGFNNNVGGFRSSVVGGASNNLGNNTQSCFIGGGESNAINSSIASDQKGMVIVGGFSNTNSSQYGFIGGGQTNSNTTNQWSSIVGGLSNSITNSYAFIGGGQSNTASGTHSTVVGGQSNTTSASHANVSGGQSNTASNTWATVGGGRNNSNGGTQAVISGGRANSIGSGAPFFGEYNVIGGGWNNNASSASSCTIGGGQNNQTNQNGATVAGGNTNICTTGAGGGFIGGGNNNTASATNAVIAGGLQIQASGNYSFCGGGAYSIASGVHSVVCGGGDPINTALRNTASGGASFIGSGQGNTASASFTSVMGGLQATASLYGQQAYSAGRFSANGDAQAHQLIWRRAVTGTAAAELFLDGVSVQAILPGTNSIWNGIIDVSAVCTTTGDGTTTVGHVEATSFKVTIKRIGTATSLVGTVQEIGTTNADASMSTASFSFDNDDTNEALRIRFTPPTTAGSTTVIRAIATFRGQQIQY